MAESFNILAEWRENVRKQDKIEFPIDHSTNQETRVQGNADLPIGVYFQHLSAYRQGYTPWHWHREAELFFVVEGMVRVTTTAGEFILKETEGCFINTNCLHSMHPYECEDVIFQSVVFDPFVISSSISMLFDEKYLYPLLKCKQIPSVLIDSSCVHHSFIYEKISSIIFREKKQEFGYEMVMRNYLSEIWLKILSLVQEEIRRAPRGANLDYERIHAMLSFIHENYASELSVEDIGQAASISVSECSRCFQRCLKQTPFDYLIDYRLRQASELLLHTDQTISEIALGVGFNSTSYFSSRFKESLGVSPREYRKKERPASE